MPAPLAGMEEPPIMDTPVRCQKCQRAAMTTVSVTFVPGGVETLRLCADHTWDFYVTMTQWFGRGLPRDEITCTAALKAKDADAFPDYIKAVS